MKCWKIQDYCRMFAILFVLTTVLRSHFFYSLLKSEKKVYFSLRLPYINRHQEVWWLIHNALSPFTRRDLLFILVSNEVCGDAGISISSMNFAGYFTRARRPHRVIPNGLIFATQNYVGGYVRRNQVEMLPGQ